MLEDNKITGTFPLALCDVWYCSAKSGNNLVAPCGSTDCCDLGNGAACPAPTVTPSATPTDAPTAIPVTIFGVDYDPETTVNLRAPPAFPTPGAARDTASAS